MVRSSSKRLTTSQDATTQKSHSVKQTRRYNIFEYNSDNRAVNIARHRRLLQSMKKYGFLPWWPIVVRRIGKSSFVILDGQHRYAIAKELGLAIWYIVSDNRFDIAVINDTQKTWQARDYAEVFQAQGKQDYSIGLEFMQNHGLPIGVCFAILSGQVSYSNVEIAFKAGKFKVVALPWATLVAKTYTPIASLKKEAKHSKMLEAIMVCCLVEVFEPSRLINMAEKNRDMLVSCSNREGFLVMLERLYNFRRSPKHKIPLKHLAEVAYAEKYPRNERK